MTRAVSGWLLAFVLLAIFPLLPASVASTFHLELATKVVILSIFALSLQLLVGYAGMVSLGHAAFFGIAGYLVALLAPPSAPGNGWLLLGAALGGALLLALVIGALSLRTRGVYFIMVTLAFGQMVFFVFHDTSLAGGSDGAYIYFKPEFRLLGHALIQLDNLAQFYWFALGCLALTVGVIGLALRSRFGHALAGIKHNEKRMLAAGYQTGRYKLACFALGGMLAGLAGFLHAVQYGFVNPEILAWHQSGNALLMVIIGGIGSLPGAVLGALSFTLLAEWFTALTKHWQLLMGGFIIVSVAVLPQGLAGGLRRGLTRRRAPAREAA